MGSLDDAESATSVASVDSAVFLKVQDRLWTPKPFERQFFLGSIPTLQHPDSCAYRPALN